MLRRQIRYSVKTTAKKDIKQAGIPHKNERWNSCLKFL